MSLNHTYWRANIGSATYQLFFSTLHKLQDLVSLYLKLDTFYYYKNDVYYLFGTGSQ